MKSCDSSERNFAMQKKNNNNNIVSCDENVFDLFELFFFLIFACQYGHKNEAKKIIQTTSRSHNFTIKLNNTEKSAMQQILNIFFSYLLLAFYSSRLYRHTK